MIPRIIFGIGIVICWATAACSWASTPAGTLYPGLPDPALEARTAARAGDGKITVRGSSESLPIADICFANWQITGTGKKPGSN